MDTHGHAHLQRRVHELESLCAEIYVAGVEFGLPQALLERLWTVAAEGNAPEAYRLDPPERRDRPESVRTRPMASMPMPDLGHLDRALSRVMPKTEADAGDARFKPIPRQQVLVVDDDPLMLEVLTRILKHENFELLTAGSGPEAIERLSDGAIDLLITDFHMPEMTGPMLADVLRQRMPGLKVLYQTGFSDGLFDGRPELGASEAFLEKPFTSSGLREAARLVLFDQINP